MDNTDWQLFSFEALGLLHAFPIKCLPNTQILLITIVCLLVTLSDKIGVLQRCWLILAPTTITQVFFFQITLSFRIQWTGLVCNSHFVTWSIKHTYSQDLTFHKINIFSTSSRSFLRESFFFFF